MSRSSSHGINPLCLSAPKAVPPVSTYPTLCFSNTCEGKNTIMKNGNLRKLKQYRLKYFYHCINYNCILFIPVCRDFASWYVHATMTGAVRDIFVSSFV